MTNKSNFHVVETGLFNDNSGKASEPFNIRNFLKDTLGLTGMEVSLNQIPAGETVPFYHKHQENEELYLFINGQGQFYVDGEIFDVKEGTAIRVDPEGVRTLRNTGDEELNYICIQAKSNSLHQWTGSDGELIDKPVEWPES